MFWSASGVNIVFQYYSKLIVSQLSRVSPTVNKLIENEHNCDISGSVDIDLESLIVERAGMSNFTQSS